MLPDETPVLISSERGEWGEFTAEEVAGGPEGQVASRWQITAKPCKRLFTRVAEMRENNYGLETPRLPDEMAVLILNERGNLGRI